jgi:hypothetical protein
VIVAAPEDDPVDGEAVLFGDVARGQILGTDDGYNMIAAEGGEGIVADGARGFGGESLVPVMAMDVIADFEFGRAVDFLPDGTTVADELAGGFKDEAEKAGAGRIAGGLAGDPLLDFGGGEAAWIPAQGFLVAEDGVEGGRVVRGHFAHVEARSLEDGHRVQGTACRVPNAEKRTAVSG